VTVLARRKFNWHVTNVFIPTAAFLLISWLTFFYGADARSERNDISIATLLASISNKYVEMSNVVIFLFTIYFITIGYLLTYFSWSFIHLLDL
jgi:hypothetical protein